MKQNLKAVRAWKLLVLALELSSLHTEIAYRDGVTRRETQRVKYVSRRLFCEEIHNLILHRLSLLLNPGMSGE